MNNNKVTGVATPTATTDAATKGYVNTAVPAYKVITGTMGAPSTNTVILSGLSTKTPINGKLVNGKMWVERSANEWFDVAASYTVVAGGFPSFQLTYNDNTKALYAWFSSAKGATWSGRFKYEYFERA